MSNSRHRCCFIDTLSEAYLVVNYVDLLDTYFTRLVPVSYEFGQHWKVSAPV